MKRIVLMTIGVFLAVASIWSLTFINKKVPNDADEAWLTRRSLIEMGNIIIHYYEISDVAEWKLLQESHNLDELWALIHKKRDSVGQPLVPIPVEKHYRVDAWNSPYILEIKAGGDETVVRINSKGQGTDLYNEITFGNKKRTVRERRSWEPNN